KGRVQAGNSQPHVGVGGRFMLGIHVRKQALNDLGRRASISDPRSAATNSWVTTPPGSSRTGGTRSCPRTGPAIPFILPDSRRTYKLPGASIIFVKLLGPYCDRFFGVLAVGRRCRHAAWHRGYRGVFEPEQ